MLAKFTSPWIPDTLLENLFSSFKIDWETTLSSADENDNNTDSDSTIMTQNNDS